VTEEELISVLAGLPGVAATTASQASGAPEVAWGDSFFFYDPGDNPDDRRFPFATIVTKDYPGFDTASDLDRPGVFRLNLSIGRESFRRLFGFPPAEFAAHMDGFDYTVFDRVIPHPTYGQQGWVSIVLPGEATAAEVRDLITEAYERVRDRHKPR
jgi:hypothetical protein